MAAPSRLSRRRLLGSSAAVASAALWSRSVRAADSNGDDIRCGIIGVGGRGSGLLAAMNKAPGVRVTAICDINKDHLNRAAKDVEQDRPKLFDDYRALVGYPELDAVVVATPCFLHKEHDIAVLESNRHCYGEKPLALSVADCDAIVAAAKKSKGIFQIGTQLRYVAPWNSAITAIRKGDFGKPIMIRAHRHNVGDYPRSSEWFFHRAMSGDTIMEQAVHEFDLFNWILDGIPESASGFGGKSSVHNEPADRDTMDHYVLSLNYGSKGQISYNHSWIATPKTYCDGRQEVVYCEHATVDIENGKIFPREGEVTKVDPNPAGDHTQAGINNFFACIREHKTPLTNVETGRNCALVGLLGQRAIDTGKVVTMKELLSQG